MQTTRLNKAIYLALGVVIAGFVGSFNFAPYNAWYAGLLSLCILFYVLGQCRWRTGLVYLYLFWLSFFLSSMSWVYLGIRLFAGVSVEKSILLTIFSAAFYSLFLCLPWLISFKSPSESKWRFLSLPLVWIVAEWSRYWVLGGLTWSLIGYGHQSTWLAGWIPVFGVLGASFFVTLSAVFILIVVKTKLTFNDKTGLAVLISLITIWLGGYGLKHIEWTKEVGNSTQLSIPVTIVQPNKLDQNRRYPNRQELYKDWAKSMEELNQNNWNEGILLWPEGGIKGDKDSLSTQVQKFQDQAKSSSTNLITGGLFYADSDEGSPLEYDDKKYNSVYGLGEASGLYHKVKMAPIGEYTPLSGFLGRLFGRTTDSPHAFNSLYQEPLQINYQSQTYWLSSSICYEIAFGNEIRKASKEANILANLSNDLWFDGSHQQDQSLQIAQIRALENQKPMLRAAVTGISAVIDYRGNIVEDFPSGGTGLINAEIQPREGITPYSRFGDLPVLILGMMVFLVGFFIRTLT